MKTSIILAISVTLNALLALAYCRKSPVLAAAHKLQADEICNAASQVRVVEKLITNIVHIPSASAPFDWRAVESEDYKQYIANLRAIGCPEKTLHDIIVADVNDLYRQRVKSSPSNRFEYWKPGLLGNAFDEKRVTLQQEQAKEKRTLLQTLLGSGYSEKCDPAAGQIISTMEQLTGDFLSPEKQAAMKAIEGKYATRLLKAAKDQSGEDGQAMKLVLADKDAEVLTLLSPEEKFEYDLRLSQPAILLRMNMGEFEPSEEEFRQMFKSAKKFSDQYGLNIFTASAGTVETGGPANEMVNEFKLVLGEQRFQAFQKQSAWATQSKPGHP